MNNQVYIEQLTFENLSEPRLEGYGCFHFHSLDSHTHRHCDFYEIILFTYGTYSYIHNKKSEPMSKGTMLILKPHTIHRLYTEPMKATHFSMDIEQNFFEEYVKHHFPELNLDSLPELAKINLEPEEEAYIEHLAHRFCAPNPSIHVGNLILHTALSHLIFYQESKQNNDAYYVNEIISILNNPANLSLSVTELCNYFHESIPTILKNFKYQTGYTIIEYKNKKRLDIACDMLRDPDLKITDIAFHLNYDSLSYFLRAFKKRFGMTPTEYRTQLKVQRNIVQ